jgi:hypothetical protein
MDVTIAVVLVVTPRLESSVEHPETISVTTVWSVELLQAAWEHMPESQVLIPGITELVFEFVTTSEIIPDGFKHAALDEDAVFSNAVWHCEESD